MDFMRAHETRRAGFSIVETLAVVVTVSLLIFLMLPALLASRDAAMRLKCMHNMKQVGLALENYQTYHRVLPPGVVNPVGPVGVRSEGQKIGWIVQLLPFLDQHAVWRTIDTSRPFDDPSNLTAARCHLGTLTCPSDPSTRSLPGVGISSYTGCHHDVESPIDIDNHGTLFLNSRVNKADITDGTSFTVFVGEKVVNRPDSGWMSGTRATLRNTGTPINAASGPVDPNNVAVSNAGFTVGGFGSFHRGGANFAFGDGSVRFVSETIDLRVLQRLGHRSDGEPISAGAF
jgi:prepilin-type processing-associated H-X9-DG protein